MRVKIRIIGGRGGRWGVRIGYPSGERITHCIKPRFPRKVSPPSASNACFVGRQLPLTAEKCSHTIRTPGILSSRTNRRTGPAEQGPRGERIRIECFVISNSKSCQSTRATCTSGTSGASGLTPHNRFDGCVPQPRHSSVALVLKKRNKSVPESARSSIESLRSSIESVRSSIKIVTLVTEVAGGVIGP